MATESASKGSDRSRSPSRTEGATHAQDHTTAAAAAVPAHWLIKPEESRASSAGQAPVASVRKGAGKGKGKNKPGRGGGGCYGDPEIPQATTSADQLLAASQRLDGASHTDTANLLRQAAERISGLERQKEQMAQTLMAIHNLASNGLQGGNEAAGGEAATRSFLVKKGDEDLQEAHRAAMAARAVAPVFAASGTAHGGALAATASAEDMAAAKEARVQHLQDQQAEKKRQQDEAESKNRSRDALFANMLGGPGKSLGRL
mmetsp:Transcript_11136/g.25258  ORF Transcript_11136/g.25258 Transcript_11136/m.25258 type:complete len:260 (-) Transcript_11136:18-797(-)